MTEEGQSAETPVEEKVETGQTQDDVGTFEQQTREIPEKFHGKSAEEIVKSYQQLESELGRLRDESGKKDKELESYRYWYQQAQQAQQQQAPQEQPAQESVGDVDFYDKPAESFDRLYQQRRQKERIQERYENSYRMSTFAKMQAKQQYPHLFDGIDEAQLDQIIYGGVRSGTVAPEVMADPNGWAMSAWQLKGQQMQFNVGAPPPNPMNTSQTETPSQVRMSTGDKDVRVPAENLEFARKIGLTEEQAREAWKKAQEEQERRR